MKQKNVWWLMLVLVLALGLIVANCDGIDLHVNDSKSKKIKRGESAINVMGDIAGSAIDSVAEVVGADLDSLADADQANVTELGISIYSSGNMGLLTAKGVGLCPSIEDLAILEDELNGICEDSGEITVTCVCDELTITINNCKWTEDDGVNGEVTITGYNSLIILEYLVDVLGKDQALALKMFYQLIWPRGRIAAQVLPAVQTDLGESTISLDVSGAQPVLTKAGTCSAEVDITFVADPCDGKMLCGDRLDFTSDEGCGLQAAWELFLGD